MRAASSSLRIAPTFISRVMLYPTFIHCIALHLNFMHCISPLIPCIMLQCYRGAPAASSAGLHACLRWSPSVGHACLYNPFLPTFACLSFPWSRNGCISATTANVCIYVCLLHLGQARREGWQGGWQRRGCRHSSRALLASGKCVCFARFMHAVCKIYVSHDTFRFQLMCACACTCAWMFACK